MKICSKCFTEKDLNFFQKRKDSKDGYRSDCKECRNNFYSIDYSIENNFYVYVHRKKSDNEIFYVGKGRFKRAYSRHGRNNFWKKVVDKHGYIVEFLLENITNEEACINEVKYISEFGRRDLGTGTLVNMTDGGDGVSIGSIPWNKGKKLGEPWNKGLTHSQETKDKISESKIGIKTNRDAWNKGLKYSEEAKESMRGRIPWNKGLEHSDETKDKIREARVKYLESKK